ncbi:MAG: hypothetical protein OQJ97_12925 [Rhodospirillales bacterium]|nr:hypothetical protein [Rhodospirillales bacterium]
MKILFYIEPTIEWEKPNIRLWWVYYSTLMISALTTDKEECISNFRIILPNHLAKLFLKNDIPEKCWDILPNVIKAPESCLSIIDNKEIRKHFGPSSKDFVKLWYNGNYSENQLEIMANYTKSLVADFTPDVIISFSEAPFLKQAFPKTPMLFFETGPFNSWPFPASGFLDPSGTVKNSALAKLTNQPNALSQFADQVKGIGRPLNEHYKFRDKIHNTLQTNNPYAPHIGEWRRQFKELWLFPLQWPNCPHWPKDIPTTILDLVCHILEELGPERALIVTPIPYSIDDISLETRKYLEQSYPNFIFINVNSISRSPTHLLVPLCDGIISIYSNAALWAKLFDRKLVVLGENHTTGFADALSLQSIEELPPIKDYKTPEEIDIIINWLIGNYYIPLNILFRKNILTRKIKKLSQISLGAPLNPQNF